MTPCVTPGFAEVLHPTKRIFRLRHTPRLKSLTGPVSLPVLEQRECAYDHWTIAGVEFGRQSGALRRWFHRAGPEKGTGEWRFYGPDAEVVVGPDALNLDAKGWLSELPLLNGQPMAAYANVFYTTVMPAGQFIQEWKGKGDIGVYNESTKIGNHKLLINFDPNYVGSDGKPQDDGITVFLNSTDPNHSGNYIRDIKLYSAADADLIAAGEHFDPVWMDRINDFRILRTHDMQKTNFPTSVDWTILNETADQASWSNDGRGMPYELMVEIANQTRADLWINIPHTASDQYIRTAAAYVHDHLGPGLQVMVEFSNEYWTSIFDQYAYFIDGGTAAYGNAKFSAG